MALAIAQQFHNRAWRSPAGDDRVTQTLDLVRVASAWKIATLGTPVAS